MPTDTGGRVPQLPRKQWPLAKSSSIAVEATGPVTLLFLVGIALDSWLSLELLVFGSFDIFVDIVRATKLILQREHREQWKKWTNGGS